jgi:membrane protein insertase Oxa1/YidC/SpoIIIJ
MAAPLKKEPNKYAKNADIKADTLAKTLMSVAGMTLLVIGLLGIAMEFFKDDGVLGSIWDWLWEDTSHLFAIPAVAVALWLFNSYLTSSAKGEKKKSGDIPMYIMMAIGAFYVFRFVTTGGF